MRLLRAALLLLAIAGGSATARAQDDFGPPLFEEVWTLFKGKFYDRTMNGVDWEALRKKYLPAAKAAQTRRRRSSSEWRPRAASAGPHST